jgi:hypothetical protein
MSPTYVVSNPANGTVSLLPDGHTASFSPNSNYLGMASFTFTVTSSSNIAMTNIVNVLVTPIPIQPVINSISISANSLLLSGTGGTNANFYLLASTNAATPLAGWMRVPTNQFDANGNFRLTNPIGSYLRQNFFRLQVP